eukprot:356792-Chlamydomonas_euryale.AAC.2
MRLVQTNSSRGVVAAATWHQGDALAWSLLNGKEAAPARTAMGASPAEFRLSRFTSSATATTSVAHQHWS